MLEKTMVCLLVLSLMGSATSRLEDSRPPSAIPGLNAKLLQLEESAARRSGGRLGVEEVAAIFPELVELDAGGRPRAVRNDLLVPLLLDEVRRLSDRVAELEARSLQAAGAQRPEPLVRITVARNE